MNELTLEQNKLIEVCLEAKNGWQMFAAAVKQSGTCSAKQEATLRKMVRSMELVQAKTVY